MYLISYFGRYVNRWPFPSVYCPVYVNCKCRLFKLIDYLCDRSCSMSYLWHRVRESAKVTGRSPANESVYMIHASVQVQNRREKKWGRERSRERSNQKQKHNDDADSPSVDDRTQQRLQKINRLHQFRLFTSGLDHNNSASIN